MLEYEVVHMVSNPEALAKRLNDMAAQGWRVVQVVSPYDYIILERISESYLESLKQESTKSGSTVSPQPEEAKPKPMKKSKKEEQDHGKPE